jgi:hypothetical protein
MQLVLVKNSKLVLIHSTATALASGDYFISCIILQFDKIGYIRINVTVTRVRVTIVAVEKQ